nr:MAG TPA: hypothetical protein [Caudoviricetes sp.]
MYTPSSLASMPLIAPLSLMAFKSLLNTETVDNSYGGRKK